MRAARWRGGAGEVANDVEIGRRRPGFCSPYELVQALVVLENRGGTRPRFRELYHIATVRPFCEEDGPGLAASRSSFHVTEVMRRPR